MEGTIFLCGKNTPPQLSRLGQEDFAFDLQRFNYSIDEPTGQDDTLGYTSAKDSDGKDYAVEVDYGTGSNRQKRYFKDMGDALESVDGNGKSLKATVTLKQNSNSKAWDLSKDVATNVDIDLGGYTVTFITAVNQESASQKVKPIKFGRAEEGSDTTNTETNITIKNGKLTSDPSAMTTKPLERFIRSYVNLTLDGVTVDGQNCVSGQTPNDPEGALICHTQGTLTLKNGTSVLTQTGTGDDVYYAVSGKHSERTSARTIDGFHIVIDTDGELGKIGIKDWSGYQVDANTSTVSIKSGNIDPITINEKLATSGVASKLAVTGTATINGAEYTGTETAPITGFVAYKEKSADTSYIIGTLGANKSTDSDKGYNYVVAKTGANSTAQGEVVIAGEGVKSWEEAKNIAFDSANSIVGVPGGTTPTLQGNYATGYKWAGLNYSSDKTEVSVLSASADNAVISAAANGILGVPEGTAATLKSINASDVNVALSIIGNSLDNTIYGGKGVNNFTGGAGNDVFVYNGNSDGSIQDYSTVASIAGVDSIKLSSNISPVTSGASVTTESGALVLTFENNKKLTLTGTGTIENTLAADTAMIFTGKGVSVESGSGNKAYTYIYTKDNIVQKQGSTYQGVTLTSAYSKDKYDAGVDNAQYVTIDGSAVTAKALNLTGNAQPNLISGGASGGQLYGGAGDDTVIGSTVATAADTFIYSNGKDVIENYGQAGDRLSLGSSVEFTGAKISGNKLTFSTATNANSLTFVGLESNARISLTGGNDMLSKDGYTKDQKLTLFKDAKGKVDAAAFGATAGIDASAVKSNVVTMVGASVSGTFTFADNKKADVFEYGGGAAVIAGYVGGSDKINLGTATLSSFTVDDTSGAVVLDLGDNKSVSIGNAKGKEVLLHDDAVNKTNQYSKLVFAATGVVQDKESKPTSVTISAGDGYKAENTVKKILVNGTFGASAVSIVGGNVNTAIDASEVTLSGDAVMSITGGSKNDKVTLGSAKELYTYTGGKDVINGFGTGDSLAFSGDDFAIDNITKVTNNGKTLTFKFKKSSDALTIKSNATIGAVTIGEGSYQFGKKNTIIVGGVASLTSGYSGTYTADNTAASINASAVTKNLTVKGQKDTPDYIVAGGKKTMLKGQGGNDNLIGGDGVDTFYYKKGEKGDITISNFESNKDKIKISGSKVIGENGLSKNATEALTITMANGASIKIDSITGGAAAGEGNNNITNILLKANNTYYWFDTRTEGFDDSSGEHHKDEWVTSLNKISAAAARNSGYSIVDLGYSTNLVKAGLAYKADITFASKSGNS